MKYYSKENLIQLSDVELYNLVCNKAYELQSENYGDNYYIMSPPFRDFWAIHMLEAEVFNGGLHQFFSNGGFYTHAEFAQEGLKKISAHKFYYVLQKAIEIYKNYNEEIERIEVSEFDPLDKEFYDLDQGTDQLTTLNILQINYIRSNYELFTEKYNDLQQ